MNLKNLSSPSKTTPSSLLIILSLIGLFLNFDLISSSSIRLTSSSSSKFSIRSIKDENFEENSSKNNIVLEKRRVSSQINNFKLLKRQVTDAPNATNLDPNITDAVAIQADTIPWYMLDQFQQDHIRFHCYLSMASYGDYRSLCPSTFSVNGNDFEILQEFRSDLGQGGFVARVPLMDKIVIVFQGYSTYTPLSWEPVPIDFGRTIANCSSDCTTGSGILDLYNSVRILTNDWEIAKQAVNRTGHKFSVTGHGIGGSVAQLAALDLGSSGFVHYAHFQAAPRSVSPAASRLLGSMFQGESAQQVTANNDFFVHVIPRSEHFTRVGTAVWIFGNRTEWLHNCNYYTENLACLGNGTSIADHFYYFTQMGQCGSADKGF